MLPVPQVAVRGCCADLRCGHLPSCSSSRSLQPHGRGSRSAPSCSSPSRCVRLGRRKTMVLKRAASTSHPLLTPCITHTTLTHQLHRLPITPHPRRSASASHRRPGQRWMLWASCTTGRRLHVARARPTRQRRYASAPLLQPARAALAFKVALSSPPRAPPAAAGGPADGCGLRDRHARRRSFHERLLRSGPARTPRRPELLACCQRRLTAEAVCAG